MFCILYNLIKVILLTFAAPSRPHTHMHFAHQFLDAIFVGLIVLARRGRPILLPWRRIPFYESGVIAITRPSGALTNAFTSFPDTASTEW